MNQSESIKALAAALVNAQKLIKSAELDGVNPHFQSPYATLTSVKRASAEALAANGLVVVQALETDGVSNFLETRIVHTSGEWISGRMLLVVEKNTMQGLGSAITYAKRYSLAAITGVVDEDDDDGNGATAHAPKSSAPQFAGNSGASNTSPSTAARATTPAIGHGSMVSPPGGQLWNGQTAPKSASPSEGTTFSSKDYVAPVGRPDVKGKKLGDLRLDQLQNAHSYWSTAQNPPAVVPEYLQMLEARMAELEKQPDVPF